MTFKRIVVSLCTIIICMMMFIGGYVKSTTFYSYASSVPSGYQNISSRQQIADSFLAYCKSRDSNITSSILGGSSTFAYETIVNASNLLGISINDIQANIWYLQQNNGGFRYFMNSTGVNIYNEIFAYLIHEKNLEVGQPANVELYSGRYFTDKDGNTCQVYYVPDNVSRSGAQLTPSKIGSFYKYSSSDLSNLNSATYNVTSTQSFTYPIYKWRTNIHDFVSFNNTNDANNEYMSLIKAYEYNTGIPVRYGSRAIIYNTTTDKLYFGHMLQIVASTSVDPTISGYYWYCIEEIQSNDSTQNITINFVSNNIKNEYEGDTTINNNGDIINNNYPDTNYDPYPDGGGTTTGPGTGGGSGSGGTITFPDLDLDLPSINWSLGDLSEKFPFSIPFDLIAFFTVLNAEPEAPAIDAEIPLGSWYTWHFEADFSQFDNYAVIIRNVEFIGFCVALIYLTIRLIKA